MTAHPDSIFDPSYPPFPVFLTTASSETSKVPDDGLVSHNLLNHITDDELFAYVNEHRRNLLARFYWEASELFLEAHSQVKLAGSVRVARYLRELPIDSLTKIGWHIQLASGRFSCLRSDDFHLATAFVQYIEAHSDLLSQIEIIKIVRSTLQCTLTQARNLMALIVEKSVPVKAPNDDIALQTIESITSDKEFGDNFEKVFFAIFNRERYSITALGEFSFLPTPD